jgi:hypothetical protein
MNAMRLISLVIAVALIASAAVSAQTISIVLKGKSQTLTVIPPDCN